MEFIKKPIKWQNKGKKPPDELLESGFLPGYKPPASFFNYKWASDYEIIEELQEKAALKEHNHELATPEKDGFMSKEDKAKLETTTGAFAPIYHSHNSDDVTESSGETLEQSQRRQDMLLDLLLNGYASKTLIWKFTEDELSQTNILTGTIANSCITIGGIS